MSGPSRLLRVVSTEGPGLADRVLGLACLALTVRTLACEGSEKCTESVLRFVDVDAVDVTANLYQRFVGGATRNEFL